MARGIFVNEVIGRNGEGSYEPRYNIKAAGGEMLGAELALANPVIQAGTPLNAEALNNLFDFDNLDSMKGNVKTTKFEGGAGYIFSTSNCVYTGMPLERYEMMVNIWRNEGGYGND